MLERVAAAILRHGMFPPAMRVGVAVSGGADSVCLLHVLAELAPRWDLRLTVLHLDHGLRGEESRGDARFVRDLAGALGLPFVLRETRVDAGPGNLEQAGREARMAFFREQMERGTVDRVALGHTRSDQAETVLFRLLRGAGTAGLAGIRPVTADGIVRPLVELWRRDVEQFLTLRKIEWREDSTNHTPEFARNRIRHDLIPQLAREWNPAIAEVLAHTADWALAEEAYWEAEVNRLSAGQMAECSGALILEIQWLTALPVAAARRVVRRAFERVKGDLRGIGFEHAAAVLDLAATTEGHGRVQVPGLDILRSFEWLRIAPAGEYTAQDRDYSVPAVLPGVTSVPGKNLAISLELVENSKTSGASDSVYNSLMGCLDPRCLHGPYELRNWRPGDQYRPVGSESAQKIKTLFQQARVPLWDRRHWPVLTDAGTIVWSRQFGPDAAVAAGPGSNRLLRIREIGAGPCPADGDGQAKQESGSANTASK